MLGKLPDVQRQLTKPVKDRATEILRHLDEGLLLADGEPFKQDLTSFDEASSQALQKRDDILHEAEEVDQIINSLKDIQTGFNDLINQLGA